MQFLRYQGLNQAWSKPIEIQTSVSSQKFLFSLNTHYFLFADC
jgi:hypothetical protein